MGKIIMGRGISVVISLLLPLTIFQVAKILAFGIKRFNSRQAMTSALEMLGLGNIQTGIVVMMLLALVTYMIAIEIFGNK